MRGSRVVRTCAQATTRVTIPGDTIASVRRSLGSSIVTAAPLSLSLLFLPLTVSAQRILSPSGTDIVSIDPATGASTTVGPLPVSNPAQGESTYDPFGRRLFYLGINGPDPTTRLATFNVSTGTGSQVPVPSAFGFIEYDPATGRVLAPSGADVVSIDPA